MHYLDYNEHKQHRTGDFPLAYYPVDIHHERYRMPMHWHRETEVIRVGRGQLSLYIDDREVLARAGDVMLIAEGVIHGGDPEDCEYECVVFDAGLLLGSDACARSLRGVLNHSIFLSGAAIAAHGDLSDAVARLFGRCAAGGGWGVVCLSFSFPPSPPPRPARGGSPRPAPRGRAARPRRGRDRATPARRPRAA